MSTMTRIQLWWDIYKTSLAGHSARVNSDDAAKEASHSAFLAMKEYDTFVRYAAQEEGPVTTQEPGESRPMFQEAWSLGTFIQH